MDPALLTSQFETLCRKGDAPGMMDLVALLGFDEPKKSAGNLLLLFEEMGDCRQLAELALTARDCSDPDQALNALERLAAVSKAAGLLPVLSDGHLRRILLTVLGASRFLTNILCRHPDLLTGLFKAGAFDQPREEATLLNDLRRAIPDQVSFEDLQRRLRLFKQQEILRIAARDLCGMADLRTITAELSDLAAACLQRAYEVCDRLARAEYGPPLSGMHGDKDREEAHFTVLGMGKFGGRELNFSSDIDLIYCYSGEAGETAGVPDAAGRIGKRLFLHQYFVKLAESITRAMHQVTEEGFVFRVDLRLRPEGSSGEIAISQPATEFYYENWARSWERSAMLKARPVAGSKTLGNRLLKNLEPFIYRRYLDYTMIEDLKVMKQKIDRNLTREREGELNLKLGRGGIREIEFFIQAMQLIHAGKHPPLREKNSLRALALLQAEGLIDAETFVVLTEAYTFLRKVEHRIQVVEERQTHNLPTDPGEFSRLGRRCGFVDGIVFRKVLEDFRQGVENIYRNLFYTSEEEAREEVTAEIATMLDPAADPDLVKQLLGENRFADPGRAWDNLLIMRQGGTHGHMTRQAQRHLDRIAPLLLQEVIGSPEPDMAFANLADFLAALRARTTFFALLAENRPIIKLLIGLFGTSQFLSRGFIQHPEILDYLIYGANAAGIKDRTTLRKDLESLLENAVDYEGQLDVLRRFRNEEFLRIALNDIRGELQFGKRAEQLTLLAEVCLEKALHIARSELLPRFGLPFRATASGDSREAAFAIVGMGRLGGGELNYHSDLDIIFIYEEEGGTQPAPGVGKFFKSLSNQEYFSRLGQRIISVLSLITSEGFVYKIDTQLRPSGNRGPLVTSFEGYRLYHEKSAWLWERQALIKARVVVDTADISPRIRDLTRQIVYERPLPSDHRQEIYQLRQRLEGEPDRKHQTFPEFNLEAGRGGMMDVEFLVQYLQLLHGKNRPQLREPNTLDMLKALRREELLENSEYVTLANGYQFLRRLENKLRLIHDQSINQLPGDAARLTGLARSLGYREKDPGQQLLAHYHRVTEKIRAVFDRHLRP
jgi:glutamate-ammonia-ligase adenylyltransferase